MNDMLSAIKKLGESFSRRELRPRWDRMDGECGEILACMAEVLARLRFFSMLIDEKSGGVGLGIQECAVFIEEISMASPALGAMLASHVMGLAPALMSGERVNRQKILDEIVTAEARGETPVLTLCWMEEDIKLGTGLGLERMDTTLSESGDGFTVTGRKICVPLAPIAAWFITPVKTENGDFAWVCIPSLAKGVEVRAGNELMGLRLAPFGQVTFNRVELSREHILARGLGIKEVLRSFMYFDACLGAVALGMAREAYDRASFFSVQRWQGGKIICDHDAVRGMLVQMRLGIEASSALISRAAANADRGLGTRTDMLCSVTCIEAAASAALDGIQILGGYGYMRDTGMERILRDAKTFQNTFVLPRCRKAEFIRNEIELSKEPV